jgi:hypothetical protein
MDLREKMIIRPHLRNERCETFSLGISHDAGFAAIDKGGLFLWQKRGSKTK